MKLMSLVGVNRYLLRSSILIGFIFFFILPVQAQYSASTTTNGPYGYRYPDSLIQRRVNISVGGIITAYTGMIVVMEYIWYRDKASTPFHFYNDNQQWLQMDKFGHSFSAYRESQLAYHAMRWAGFSKKKALMYGGSMGFFLQLPIDIWDGLNEGYGFSWGDVLANTSGAVLFSAQEAIWDEQIVRLKHSYWPSDYRQYNPKLLGDTHLKSFFLDYNGRTQWASASISRITGIKSIPSWLCLSVGYSGGWVTDTEDKPPPHHEINTYTAIFFFFCIPIDQNEIKKPTFKKLFYFRNII